ncbi:MULTISPECIES: hypothetical protein [unclassified Roseobacter]|uniref:hypothetical protein n=1 Tax=unclassified Roseobacter TaxID=196798 RepID=UPI0030EF7AC1
MKKDLDGIVHKQKRSNVTIIFRGGLGNQLFQYANGLGRIKKGDKVAYNDIWGFLRDKRFRRKFELSSCRPFKFKISIGYCIYLGVYKFSGSLSHLRRLRKKYDIGYHQIMQQALWTLKSNKNSFLFLSSIHSPSVEGAALHFRIFNENKNSKENISTCYLKKVENILRERKIFVLDVYTDNEKIVKTIINDEDLFRDFEVFYSGSKTAVLDLRRISRYKYIFLSNSTFSLWVGLVADFLDERECIIYYPNATYTDWRFPRPCFMPGDWVSL